MAVRGDMHLQLAVLEDLDGLPLADGPAEEELPHQLGVPRVGDVVLPDVAVDPVAEVEVLIVHGDDDVGHDAGHVGQDPAGNLLRRDLDRLLGGPVSRGFPEESAAGSGRGQIVSFE